MNRTIKLYIGLLILIMAGIVAVDCNRPKPINWAPTFDINDKIPFGLFVLNQELPLALKNNDIKKIDVTPYEFFANSKNKNTIANKYKISATILYIDEFDNIDDPSAKELLTFAKQGNTVFLSGKSFPKIISDSLKIKINNDFSVQDSIFCWMANKKFDTIKYHLHANGNVSHFKTIDTLRTKILGFQQKKIKDINFIKVPFGEGQFLLHTQPVAFTNYNLLQKNNSDYTANLLSYIPKGNVIWFVKNLEKSKISTSVFRFILSQPALKWAWYLFLLGMITFMIFNAKRRQRIVPIIKPLRNTTVEFAKTIGNLYYQEANYSDMMDKKIIYFLEKLRQDYLIETIYLDDFFIKKLQQKTSKDLILVQTLVNKINHHRKKSQYATEKDLLELNALIEKLTS